MGKEGAGAETRKQSLRRFDQLLVSGKLPPERRAEAEIERALVSSWYYRAELRLAPGPQRIAVVVLDEISGVQSTVFTEVEIPKAE